MIQHSLSAPVAPNRVVVLGASGFIGSHLQAHFARVGVDVVAVASAQVDLASQDAVQLLADTVRQDDMLVFASCITRDRGDDLPTLMKNLLMAQSVGLFLERHGCAHVIHLSSDAVYKDGMPLVREESECKPDGLYGTMHMTRERIVAHSAGKAGIPLVVLRPCAVYGPGDTHNSYGPNRFLRTATTQGKISLFGQGEEIRDHIFIGDVCRLIEQCAAHRDTGMLNLATGQAYSFAQVAAAVAGVVTRPVEIEHLPRRTPITHRHFDITAFLKVFPSFAFVSLAQGLQETMEAGRA